MSHMQPAWPSEARGVRAVGCGWAMKPRHWAALPFRSGFTFAIYSHGTFGTFSAARRISRRFTRYIVQSHVHRTSRSLDGKLNSIYSLKSPASLLAPRAPGSGGWPWRPATIRDVFGYPNQKTVSQVNIDPSQRGWQTQRFKPVNDTYVHADVRCLVIVQQFQAKKPKKQTSIQRFINILQNKGHYLWRKN